MILIHLRFYVETYDTSIEIYFSVTVALDLS